MNWNVSMLHFLQPLPVITDRHYVGNDLKEIGLRQ
jgi:hypothetical protein